VFTKRRDWRRWSGPRTEVTAAVNLASTVLEEWSGKPSAVRFRISYANQLTETSDDPTALDQLHRTDLRRIEDLWIDVEPDRPFRSAPSVSFRISNGILAGIRVEVSGPDRTNVEGLTARLVEVLNRAASGPTNFSTGFGPLAAFILGVAIGLAIGVAVVVGFNLAPNNNRYEWQEIVVPAGAAMAMGTLFLAFNWALPSIELLDTGERSRFQRFRALLFSGLVAIIAGLIATAIWAAVT
jgi:hypothetical protein